MAENKKSFVAYSDWGETFNELSNEDAGKLVKHLFNYVNDLNPESDSEMVKMCFIPIKQSLKRDLRKWDNYIDKQKLNGLKGGRPKKTQITQAFISKPKKADSVSVSVNVNDNVINKKKTKKVFIPPSQIEFRKCVHDKIVEAYGENVFNKKVKGNVIAKWNAWNDADWFDGNGKKITLWKSKINHQLKYFIQ